MKNFKENNQLEKLVSQETNPKPKKEENKVSSSNINKKYKDSFFKSLFSDKRSILDLYNAIEGTSYTYDTQVDIITLEDVAYKNRMNDLCFTIDNKFVILIEHQSTINQNMPLRFLLYAAREYEKILNDDNVFKRGLIKIPTPEFIVLYNGKDKFPKRKTLQLSDAFKVQQDNPALNLIADVININYDENTEIVSRCEKLKGYSYFIYLVTKYEQEGYRLEKAINKAADQCIKEGILTEYLSKNLSEVRNMLTTEWDYDTDIRVNRQEAKEEGLQEGLQKGLQKGIQTLITTCKELEISYDITLQKIMGKYSLEEAQAKDMMNNYWK